MKIFLVDLKKNVPPQLPLFSLACFSGESHRPSIVDLVVEHRLLSPFHHSDDIIVYACPLAKPEHKHHLGRKPHLNDEIVCNVDLVLPKRLDQVEILQQILSHSSRSFEDRILEFRLKPESELFMMDNIEVFTVVHRNQIVVPRCMSIPTNCKCVHHSYRVGHGIRDTCGFAFSFLGRLFGLKN